MENLRKTEMIGTNQQNLEKGADNLSGFLEKLYKLNNNYNTIINLCHTIENKIYGDNRVNNLTSPSEEEPMPNYLIEKLNLQITELNIKGENIYKTLENIDKFLGE